MSLKRIGPLYAITDPGWIPEDRFLEVVEQALRGGVDVLQLREKDKPRDFVIERGRQLLRLCRRYRVPLIVNDHPEIAKAIGADGVHVGRDDPPIPEARALLGPRAIIGASAYGDLDLALRLQEEGADYVAFGAMFPSPTKPDEPVVPLEVLREARKVLRIPIVAIGGITLENLPLLMEQGRPDAVAVISAIFGHPDPERAAYALKMVLRRYIQKKGSEGET